MKIRAEIEGAEYVLAFDEGDPGHYRLSGAAEQSGTASVIQVGPGVCSIIDGTRSFVVRLIEMREGLEAYVNGRRILLSLSDPRDRSGVAKNASANGPQELRALMPGKVVKLLVSKGDEVKAGRGLVIVEAMKMQNEMKASKDGRVTRIHVNEGSTVAPGETLLVVE